MNYEATLACSIGDISLEETVNKTALTHFHQFISKILNNTQQDTQLNDSNINIINDQTKNTNKSSINSNLILGMLTDLKKTVFFNIKI